jgi:hypothetical protein
MGRPKVELRTLEEINGAEVFGELHLHLGLALLALELLFPELDSVDELTRDDASPSSMVSLHPLQFELKPRVRERARARRRSGVDRPARWH